MSDVAQGETRNSSADESRLAVEAHVKYIQSLDEVRIRLVKRGVVTTELTRLVHLEEG